MSYQLVRQAILQRRSIHALYEGERLEMTPHVLGTTLGSQRALCYQYGGVSSPPLAPDGSPTNWRRIEVTKLSNVDIVDGQHTAPKHARPNDWVLSIDEEAFIPAHLLPQA